MIFFEIFDLFLTIFSQLDIDSVPGRPGTEDFVPGFLLLSLSRDKGTSGEGNIFVPGQRDNGTSRPLETLVSINQIQNAVCLLKRIFRGISILFRSRVSSQYVHDVGNGI